jgi:hypothetical protein
LLTSMAWLAGCAIACGQGTIVWSDDTSSFGITVYSPQVAPPFVQMGNSSYDGSSQPDGDTPGANTVYNGVPLGGSDTGSGPTAYYNGNLWTIALYAAPGVNNTSGVMAAEAVDAYSAASLFFTTGGVGIANAGINGSGDAGEWSANVTSQALGYGSTSGNPAPNALYPASDYTDSATLQLVVWYNGGPANLSYTQAIAANDPTGVSSFESLDELGAVGNPPSVPVDLGGTALGGVNHPALVPGDGIITSFALYPLIPEPAILPLGVIGAIIVALWRRKL